MHYRNGREAMNGDKIVQLDFDTGHITAFGMLTNAQPGNDYCNGTIEPTHDIEVTACLCDCIHVDDLAAILAEKGLDKRPPGK